MNNVELRTLAMLIVLLHAGLLATLNTIRKRLTRIENHLNKE